MRKHKNCGKLRIQRSTSPTQHEFKRIKRRKRQPSAEQAAREFTRGANSRAVFFFNSAKFELNKPRDRGAALLGFVFFLFGFLEFVEEVLDKLAILSRCRCQSLGFDFDRLGEITLGEQVVCQRVE